MDHSSSLFPILITKQLELLSMEWSPLIRDAVVEGDEKLVCDWLDVTVEVTDLAAVPARLNAKLNPAALQTSELKERNVGVLVFVI